MTAPLTPTADEARELLREELSRLEYRTDSVIQSFLRRILQGLNISADANAPSLNLTPVFIVVGILVLIIITLILLRKFRFSGKNKGTGTDGLVFDNEPKSSDDYLALAKQAEKSGDFLVATVNYYRAMVKNGQERLLVSDRKGLTAFEAAGSLKEAFPSLAGQVATSTAYFEEVSYADVPATAEIVAYCRETMISVKRSSPQPSAGNGNMGGFGG